MGVLIRLGERHPDAADGSVFSAAALLPRAGHPDAADGSVFSAAALLPRAGIVKGAAASPLNTFA